VRRPLPTVAVWALAAQLTERPRECEAELVVELIFEVTQETDAGYCAECLTHDIFTQGETWDELRDNVREAVRAYFFDGAIPERVRFCTSSVTKCSRRDEDTTRLGRRGFGELPLPAMCLRIVR
jgi:hypothetical protein